MEKRLKSFLAIAACIAFACNTVTPVMGETVTISALISATASGTTKKVTVGSDTYNWDRSNVSSATVNLVGGELTVNGYSSTVENGLLTATSGDLYLDSGTLTIASGSSIASDVNTAIKGSSTLSVTGGNVALDGNNDNWIGTVAVDSGVLNIKDVNKNSSANLTQVGGTTNITGTGFDLNSSSDSISGGNLNIGNGSTNSSLGVSAGSITAGTNVKLTANSNLNITGGNAVLNNGDTWSGNVNVNGGSLALVGINKNTSATFNQTSGTTTVTGSEFNLNNNLDLVNGGTLNVGNNENNTVLNVSSGAISSATNLNISENSTVNVSGGNVEYGGNSTWGGNVNVTNGNLKIYNSKNSSANLTQTDGTTTVYGNNFDLNDASDSISGGTLNIGDSSNSGNLHVSYGKIEAGSNVVVYEGSTISLEGGNVNLDSGDTWRGTINTSSGTLNLDSATKESSGIYTQTGGTTNVLGTTFDLNNASDNISGGNLNIGSSDGTGTAAQMGVSKGTIGANTNITLNSNSTLDISGGNVSIDGNDIWNGNVNVNGGTVSLSNVNNKNGSLTQTDGTTTVHGTSSLNNASDNISGGTLNIGDGSTGANLNVTAGSIGNDANVNVQNNSNLNVSGGNVNLNNNDTWSGNVNVQSGTLNLQDVNKSASGILTQTGGTTNITGAGFNMNGASDNISGGNLVIGDGSNGTIMTLSNGVIGDGANVNISKSSVLDVSGGNATLNSGDTWNGTANVSGGSLALVGITKNTSGVLTQTSGTTTVSGEGLDLNNTSDSISGGTFNIGNGNNSATVGISKGTITTGTSLNINNNSNLNITGGNVGYGANSNWSGNINLSNGNLTIHSGKNSSGKLVQTGGNTTVYGNNFDLNNISDSITGGTLSVGDSENTANMSVSYGTIGAGSNVLLNEGSKIDVNGGNVTLDGTDNWKGTVNVTDGTLNVSNANKNNKGILTQTGGTTNVSGTSFTLNNASDNISGGNLNIGSTNGKTTTAATMAVENGTINSGANVNLYSGSVLDLRGGTTLLDNSDNWAGNVNLKDGTLAIFGITDKTGSLTQTGGNTVVYGTTILNNNSDNISGGLLYIGDSDNSAELKVRAGTIGNDANVNINSNSRLNVDGGTVNLNSGDNWNGTVAVDSGVLNIKDVNKNSSANLTQVDGTTNITGNGFDLNSSSDIISGGTLNIGNGSTDSSLGVSAGSITAGTNVKLTANSNLNVSGGNVTLNSGDTWNGNVNMSGGSLALIGIAKNTSGYLNQTDGVTTVTGDKFVLNNSYDRVSGGTFNVGDGIGDSIVGISNGAIEQAASTNINEGSKLNISGGRVDLDSGTDNWSGSISLTNGRLNLNSMSKNAVGTFTQTGGTTNVIGTGFDLNNNNDSINSGTLNVGDGTTISGLNVSEGTVASNAELVINTKGIVNVSGGTVNIDNNDNWNGNVNVTGGSFNINGTSKNSEGILTQTGGTTNVSGTNFTLNNASDNISGGNLNIGSTNGKTTTAATMTVENGFIGSDTNVNLYSGSTLNLRGGTTLLDNNDNWAGNVKLNAGTLALFGVKDKTGSFTQTGGDTVVYGTTELNNNSDNISGGSLYIGDSNNSAELKLGAGTIESAANVIINEGSDLDIKGGTVNLDSTDVWNGNVNMYSGTLDLDGVTKASAGKYTQSGGTTNVTGTTFDLNNASDNVSGGTFNVGDGTKEASISVSNGYINSGAEVNINSNATMNVSGGNVSIDNADTWNGNINVTDGNLALANVTKDSSAKYTQSGGTTTVTGTTFDLNNASDNVLGGTFNIGGGNDASVVAISKGNIAKDVVTNIQSDATLNITGGNVALNNGDKWYGNVNLTKGNLNLDSITKDLDGVLTQTAGTTTVTGSGSSLNNESDTISGGYLKIGDGENSGVLNVEKGVIDNAVNTTLFSGSTLNVDGGTVNLDGNNDTISGNINVSSGVLNLSSNFEKISTATDNFNQTGGTTNIDMSTLVLDRPTSKITGGSVKLTNGSKLIINNSTANSSALDSTDSKLTIGSGSSYTTTGGTVDSASSVNIDSNSTLSVSGSDADVTLDGINDTWNGNAKLSKGKLRLTNNLSKTTSDSGNYVQTGGDLSVDSSTLVLNDANSKISAGSVNLGNKSVLTVTDSGAEITGGNIVIDDSSVLNYLAQKGLIQYTADNGINIDTSGLINMANNVRTHSSINSLTVNNDTGDGKADFIIDVLARNDNGKPEADTITANSIKVATQGKDGTVYLSDWNLNGDVFGKNAPNKKHINLGKIFDSNNIGSDVKFGASDKEVLTPLGYYKLKASPDNDGSYSLDLTRFNPQIYRGQVATLSTYMNQLAFNDTLFNRAQIRRYGLSYDQWFKNKTAIVEGSAVYERTMKDAGVWTEVFGNFETLKFNRGLNKVRNNSWGFIVGGDFGMKNLKKGWTFLPSAYIAYNGGHQTFNSVGMWENGGQIGFMGSWMKQNFIETVLAYGGIYGTEMNVAGSSENTFNYFLGAASKTAYDWKLGSHVKIQPALTLSYNFFGKQNWHTNYGQLGLHSNFLNGFNIAPNVNFIYQRETWNMYAGIAYAWNLFGGADGSVDGLDLPSLKMSKGYIQYGFGFSKSFSDRFMTYAQASMRNIGRTGVIFQGGLNWRL